MADDVEAFIHVHGLKDSTLIGHSMFVAIKASRRVTETDRPGVPKLQ